MGTPAFPNRPESDVQRTRSQVVEVMEANSGASLGVTPRREETVPAAAPVADLKGPVVMTCTVEALEEARRTLAEMLLRDGQSMPIPSVDLPCMKVLRELQHLGSEIERLSAIAVNVNDMMISLFGDEGFLKRYRNDLPHLKKSLVRQLVSMFFKEKPLRCFLQASTTTVYLGNELMQKSAICPHSLLYTNSSVFPLTVLRKNIDYKVYAFCGPGYDPVCGGWLFPEEDATTTEELRRLFLRELDPLTTAFVTPRWVSSDGTLYFERKEAAHLVRVLAKEASELVITLMANRLVQGAPNAESELFPVLVAAPEARKEDSKMCLLVAGEPDTRDIKNWGQSFALLGFDVHWYDPSDSNWLRYFEPPGIRS